MTPEEPARRLRPHGWLLDSEDRWFHPRLRLRVEDLEAALAVPEAQLQAFHDETLWSTQPPNDPPELDPDLARALRNRRMTWNGWTSAFVGPSGVHLPWPELGPLGASGLERLLRKVEAAEEERRRRSVISVVGLALLAGWVGLGWRLGTVPFLLGAEALAVFAWWWRPRSGVPDIWEGLDIDRPDQMTADAISELGEPWAPALVRAGAHLLPDDRVEIMGRSIAMDELEAHFTPEGLATLCDGIGPERPEEEEEEDDA